MTPILLSVLSDNLIEVLAPYNRKISAPGYTISKTSEEGLTGSLYLIEGTFKETITVVVGNGKGIGDELTFKI